MDEKEFAMICSMKMYPGAAGPQLSVSEETFAAIKRQMQHQQYRLKLRVHRQEKCLKKYLARMGSGESLTSIAKSVEFSPCMMARLLLDAKYGWSKTTISNLFKEAMKDEIDDEADAPNRRGLSEDEFARVVREVDGSNGLLFYSTTSLIVDGWIDT